MRKPGTALCKLGAVELSPALEWLFRTSVALVLVGRAWQHLRWNAPFTALLWSQDLFEGVVQSWFGMSWQAWATSQTVAQGIDSLSRVHGVFYLISGVLAVLPLRAARARRVQGVFLAVATLMLLALAGLELLDNKRQIGTLLGRMLQVTLPLILAAMLHAGHRLTVAHQHCLRIALAGTFLGHGLYASGLHYEVPGEFVTMTMESLHVSESFALKLLRVAGCLDFLVAAALLMSLWQQLLWLDAPILMYAAIWGTLTAVARIWTFFRWDMALDRISQWLHETLVRLPHGLIPALLLLIIAGHVRSRATHSHSPPPSWKKQ